MLYCPEKCVQLVSIGIALVEFQRFPDVGFRLLEIPIHEETNGSHGMMCDGILIVQLQSRLR